MSHIVGEIGATLGLILNEGVQAMTIVGCRRRNDRGAVNLSCVYAHIDVWAPLISGQRPLVDIAAFVRHV